MPGPGALRCSTAASLVAISTACAGGEWREPPPIAAAAYEQEMHDWRAERRAVLEYAVKLVGVWPLDQGDTPFGADSSVPVVLRGSGVPPRAGVLRRRGGQVSVVPAAGVTLWANGAAVSGETPLATVMDSLPTVLAAGTLRLQIEEVEEVSKDADERRWVSASDTAHPALAGLQPVATFPVAMPWRVAARFDAFDAPRQMQVPDVRGGVIDLVATGALVFRIANREHRLTAIRLPEGELLVMFRDSTSGVTTYGGYRALYPRAVANGEWAVLDFNKSANPPCAYSAYTTCPLAPRENRLALTVEAGEKMHASKRGYAP